MAVREVIKSRKFDLGKKIYYKEDIIYILKSIKEIGLYYPFFKLDNYYLEDIKDLDSDTLKNIKSYDEFKVTVFENNEDSTKGDDYKVLEYIISSKSSHDMLWINNFSNLKLNNLAEVLQKKPNSYTRKHFRFYLIFLLGVLSMILSIVSCIVLMNIFKHYSITIALSNLSVVILIGFLTIISISSRFINKSLIFNIDSSQSFLKRNKENIQISSFFTIFGAILGGIIGFLIALLS